MFGGVWFNDRLNSVAQTNNDLTDQLQAAEQREAEVMAAIKTQQDMTYKAPLMSANPGSSVDLLERDWRLDICAWSDDGVPDGYQCPRLSC